MIDKKNYDRFLIKQLFCYLFLYKTFIECIYSYVISPLYSYSGLSLSINKYGYLISNCYLLFIVISSPKDKKRVSTYLFIMMEIFIIIPVLSYYCMNNQSIVYTTFVTVSTILISIMLKFKPIPVKIKSTTAKVWLYMIFVTYIFSTIYLIIKRGGIDVRALNFDLIYDLRSENQISGFAGYLMNWGTKALCPFFLAYFYYRKKYIIMLSIIALQLMMYLSFGNKAFLLSIGVIFMGIIITKRGRYIQETVFCMIGLNIIAYFLSNFGISDSLRTAIPYRLTFIPAQIQFQYYEFFTNQKKLFFADGIIGKLLNIQSPFSQNISFIIGSYFSHNGLGSNSNTGIFSDAYANGGIILMISISIIFGIILNFIDSITEKIPLYISVGSLSYMIIILNDTALLTTLLTGGLWLVILLLLLFNSSVEMESNSINVSSNGLTKKLNVPVKKTLIKEKLYET